MKKIVKKHFKVNRLDLVYFCTFFYENDLLDYLHGDFVFDRTGVFRLGYSDGVRVSFNFFSIPNDEMQQALRLLGAFFDGVTFEFDKNKVDNISKLMIESDRNAYIHGKPRKENVLIEAKCMDDLTKARSRKYHIEKRRESNTYLIVSKKKGPNLFKNGRHLINELLFEDSELIDMYSDIFKNCGFNLKLIKKE